MKQIRVMQLFRRNKPIRFIALAIAFAYFSGLAITSLVHPLLHRQHETVQHTVAEEKDACHRAVYHGERENSSDHHTHLSTPDDACTLCDLIIHGEHLLIQSIAVAPLVYAKSSKTLLFFSLTYGFHSFSSSRAPPVIS